MAQDRLPCKHEEAHNNNEAVNGQDQNEHRQLAGLIFMCDEATKMDCFKYRVFGLSMKKKNLMDMITTGMRLFLFDVKLKVMHGIYAASSDGAFNLEPDAFRGNFPWQVKFHIEKACIPLPEDVFKPAIKDNYFACRRFKAELTSEQVQKLMKLFSPLPQDPDINGPQIHDTPMGKMASFAETCTQSQDKRPQGILPPDTTYSEANGTLKSDTPVQILYEPTPPLLERVVIEKRIIDHRTPQTAEGLPQCMPACATRHMLDAVMDDHSPSYELVDSTKGLVSRTCSYGFHASGAQHEHIHSDIQTALVGRFSNVLHNKVMNKRCMHNIFSPEILGQETCVQDIGVAAKACALVESLPSYSQRYVCGHSASVNCLCWCLQDLLPTSIQGTVWDGNYHDEPFVDSSVPSLHASCAPFTIGVSYDLPGHTCKALGHKRSFQEMFGCNHMHAQGAVNTCGQRPNECMHHQAFD